jgi:hypothetical protein
MSEAGVERVLPILHFLDFAERCRQNRGAWIARGSEPAQPRFVCQSHKPAEFIRIGPVRARDRQNGSFSAWNFSAHKLVGSDPEASMIPW